MRVTAVLDGMGGVPERDAAALSAFLDDGLSGAGAAAPAGESIIFYEHDRDRDRLARLAPTPDARLIKAPALNPDLLVGALVEAVRDGSSELLLFAGGSGGIELATRVAGRTGGAALTGARAGHLSQLRLLWPPDRALRALRPALLRQHRRRVVGRAGSPGDRPPDRVRHRCSGRHG